MANYSTATDIQFGKDLINQAHKYIASKRNWSWGQVESTFTTTASQTQVSLPADYQKLISIKVTVNGDDYIPEEITNPVDFDKLRAFDNTSTSDYPIYYHIRGDKIKFFPSIKSAGNTGTILYQARPVEMSADDYTTGTITVTNGDATVTGSGTTFANPQMVGRYLQVTSDSGDYRYYKIASITSTTELELDIPYEGTTQAGVNYKIAPVPVIPQEYQDIIWLRALSQWWILKADEERANFYDNRVQELIQEMERVYVSKSYNNTSNRFGNPKTMNPNYNPSVIDIT